MSSVKRHQSSRQLIYILRRTLNMSSYYSGCVQGYKSIPKAVDTEGLCIRWKVLSCVQYNECDYELSMPYWGWRVLEGRFSPRGIYLKGFTAFTGFNKSNQVFQLMAPRGSEVHFKICITMFTWHIDAEQPQQPRLMELSLVLQLFDQRAKQWQI